jgi:hypothetical protein
MKRDHLYVFKRLMFMMLCAWLAGECAVPAGATDLNQALLKSVLPWGLYQIQPTSPEVPFKLASDVGGVQWPSRDPFWVEFEKQQQRKQKEIDRALMDWHNAKQREQSWSHWFSTHQWLVGPLIVLVALLANFLFRKH